MSPVVAYCCLQVSKHARRWSVVSPSSRPSPGGEMWTIPVAHSLHGRRCRRWRRRERPGTTGIEAAGACEGDVRWAGRNAGQVGRKNYRGVGVILGSPGANAPRGKQFGSGSTRRPCVRQMSRHVSRFT